MKTVLEQIIFDLYNFTDEFKNHIVYEILYEGKGKKAAVKEYQLPSTQILVFWIRNF